MEHKQINSEDVSCPPLSKALRVIKEFCRTVTHQMPTEVFPCSKYWASLCCGGGSPKGESPSVSRHFWPKELKNWPNLLLSATDAPPALWGFIPVQFSVILPHSDVLQSTAHCKVSDVMAVTPELCNRNPPAETKSRNNAPASWASAVPEKSKGRIALLMVKNEFCEEGAGGHFRFHVKETNHKLTFYKGQMKNWVSQGCREFLLSA